MWLKEKYIKNISQVLQIQCSNKMFHIKLSVFKRTCFTAYIHSSYAQPDKPCVIFFRVSGNGRETTENIQIVKEKKKKPVENLPNSSSGFGNYRCSQESGLNLRLS